MSHFGLIQRRKVSSAQPHLHLSWIMIMRRGVSIHYIISLYTGLEAVEQAFAVKRKRQKTFPSYMSSPPLNPARKYE